MRMFQPVIILLACSLIARAQTNFTILTSFNGPPDASVSFGSLVADSDGVLYGTTIAGGISNQGAIFRVNHDGGDFKLLASLFGTYAGLVLGSDGRLYGTTYAGGTSNCGTVFGINRDGSGFAVLQSFTGGADGKNPEAALIEGDDGALYGTTYFLNSTNRGTIFKINKDGSGYATIHTFIGNPEGQQPMGRLLLASDGALYGTTGFGGAHGAGTIFTVNENGGGFNTLYAFRSITSDGGDPVAGLLEGSDHVLYGTAYASGGTGTNGIIFKINKDGNGYQILHRFSTSGGDGQRPNGVLLEGLDGALYGGAEYGGVSLNGTIYKINKDGGGYTTLRSFLGNGDAASPRCALIQLGDGTIYGTSEFGAVHGAGCVFALSSAPLSPRMQSISCLNGTNLVVCSGTSAVEYDLLRSTNFSSWSLLVTLTSQTNGQFKYFDTNAAGVCGFYRSRIH